MDVGDYDKRTVAHLAAAEGHMDILLYLINNSNFNFELEDRWGRKPIDEIKNRNFKSEI